MSFAGRSRAASALLIVLGTGGCAVGPDYRRPEPAMPPAYAESASAVGTALSLADGDLSAWWTQFADPTLNRLIDRALRASLTLEAAASRIREARLQEVQTAAAEYPSVSATGSTLRYRSNMYTASPASGSTGSASGGSALALPSRLHLYSAGFDATWEVDLFGATRRAAERARANTEESIWARRDGEVSLTAEIANDYLTLRSLQARIAVAQAALERQKALLELVQARRQAGFVTNLDVHQQSTLVSTAAAQVPPLDAEARARIHALGVLLAAPPEALQSELSAGDGQISAPPPTLPLGLPSELLLRRPDIREAERRLAASNAEIGVKATSLYPKLNLIGLTSFAAMSLGNFFSNQNLMAAALGMVSEPLFDAGRNRAALAAAKEENVQAELAYRITVLGALRDVEDALARCTAEGSRRELLSATVNAAQGSLAIAQDQYRTGLVTFVNVLQAQYALLNAEDQLTQSDGTATTDLVALYKALGGGWSSADLAVTSDAASRSAR